MTSPRHACDRISLTVLVDNQPGAGCTPAHGFALWVEAGGTRVLYDTGPDPALLAANARSLGVDLAQVDAVVLSHGHGDHSGGLPVVAQAVAGRRVPVFLHPAAIRERWSLHHATPHAIGMPEAARSVLAGPALEAQWTGQATVLRPGIRCTGAIPRLSGEDVGGRFACDAAGTVPDDIPDDQALVLTTAAGLVVITGCCHAGLINTVAAIRLAWGAHPIRAVIGGLHLHKAGDDRLARTAALLDELDLDLLAVGHCTGPAAVVGALGASGFCCGWRWTA